LFLLARREDCLRRILPFPPVTAARLVIVTGVIVTVRVTALEGGGVRSTPLFSPRSGIFAGFKGSRGQFHEKISASFRDKPNRQNPAIFPV